MFYSLLNVMFQYLMVCNAGLALNVDREKIVALFSPYTTVQNVVMKRKKSYCFVECIDQSTACIAFNAIHGKLFLNEVHGPLYLLYVEKSTWSIYVEFVSFSSFLTKLMIVFYVSARRRPRNIPSDT